MTKILAVYDNGGKTMDRYSVYTDDVDHIQYGKKLYMVLGMSNNPNSPQGFSQWSSGTLGAHNGKKIAFSSLPKHIQQHVRSRLGIPEKSISKSRRR